MVKNLIREDRQTNNRTRRPGEVTSCGALVYKSQSNAFRGHVATKIRLGFAALPAQAWWQALLILYVNTGMNLAECLPGGSR